MVRLRFLGTVLLATGAAFADTTFVSGAAEPSSTSPPATMSISPNLASVARNPVPLVNQPLVPDAVKPGGAGFTLTVTGAGFVSGATVHWNGGGRTTTFVSSSRLTARILAADIAKTGTASVTVVNPGPGGGTSNPVFFEVTIPSSSMAFGSPTDFSTPVQPGFAAVGDFNGDGKLDLAVTAYLTGVSILLGNGDGTFRPQVSYATGSAPLAVAVGDFNGDGKPDLAVTNEGDGTVRVLLGNGDGTFRAAGSYATGGNSPYFVVVGDFNRDGKLDLVATNRYGNNISVFLGNGDGTFQPAVNYAAGNQPVSIAVGDFNGDGKLDLAVANYGSDNVSVFLGNGDGTFRAAVDYSTGSGSLPQSLAAADFNGDGKLDLAVATSAGTSVLLGKGDGTFQTAGNFPDGGAWVVAADFNGDGKTDLVVANAGLSVLLGNGDGTFQPPLNYGVTQPIAAMVGDFNGDGRLDVAVTSIQSVVAVLLQTPIVSLSKSSVNFVSQLVGTTSAAQAVTFTNVSGFTLTLSSVVVTGTNAGDFKQTNGCGSALLPGGRCTITVTFTPTHTGPRSAVVTITDTATGSPQQIALSGTGVASGPNATLVPASLTYLTQLLGTASATQSVTLSNYGLAPLKVSGVAASGDFSAASACGSSVPAGASCTITVTFKPTQIGARTGRLSITDNAPGSPHIVSLSGTGTVVTLNPNSLFFYVRSVHACSTDTTTLTNTSNSTITITGISVTPRPTFTQSNDCGSSVGAGKSCNIAVTFCSPSYYHQTGAVSVSDNGGGSPQQVTLSGYTQCCK